MLKIGLFETRDGARVRGGKPEVRRTGDAFTTELADAVASGADQDFADLMNDLADQERRFLDRRDLHELAKYRALVKRILDLATSGSLQVETLKRRGASKKMDFQVIRTISDRLDEIARKISSGNKAFDLFRDIDEIRGLILDLVK
jgi:uncharacterized protein YaaR (DUF327 family)